LSKPSTLQKRLEGLSTESLRGMRRGIEKESLRVRPDGKLSTLPHPTALGSALTHPHITTDFSESQLELITGVHADADACLDELQRIHQYVYRNIGEEMLWVASMPCGLPGDDAIPLGRYGISNVGQAKTVYRKGLGFRYGRRMQTISGIHYNFSLPGVSNEGYFSLIRNFRRQSWLLLTLFGASPAVCSSFVAGREHDLETLQEGTLYRPHATSLRMGRLGYQSDAQSTLAVSYNSLESYGASLQDALTRPYPAYEAIGLREPGAAGEGAESYRQLATTLLQIENEFYGTIRPKRTIRQGERPLHALRERGIEYVEVRCMDLDPFCPIGISAQTMRFLDIFLLHCLLSDSPPDTPGEIAALGRNQHRAAARGREPGLLLERAGSETTLSDWAREVLAECAPIAEALDAAHGGSGYRDALSAAGAALATPDSLPSARVLASMQGRHDCTYVYFVLAQSLLHGDALRRLPLDEALLAQLTAAAARSMDEQRAIEAADTMPFELYRQKYLAPERLRA
jgi:glutamate--cysteine ligase